MKKAFCFLLLAGNCLITSYLYSQTWNKVGTGVHPAGGGVAMGIYKNELYYGGLYSSPSSANIIKWDGSIWTPMDTVTGWSYCFLEYNNNLYIGGNFKSVNGVPAGRIAKWNGTNWVAIVLTGSITYINSMVAFNGDIYAAGQFSSIGGVNTSGVAKWNGTSWSSVNGGLQYGTINPNGYALAVYNNNLYVGGDFGMAGNTSANNAARWNGTTWDSLGSGTNARVDAMTLDTINNFLYIGGEFTSAGGKNDYSITKWDGFQLDSAGNPWGYGIDCLAMYHGQLYAGGFGMTGKTTDTILTRWDGKQWYPVFGPNNTIESLCVYKDELYVGGYFNQIGNDTSIKYIARYSAPWDSSSSCKFLQPIIESMLSLTAPSGVADTFYYTDSVAVQFYNNIASASTWQWSYGDGNTGSGKTPVHYYKAAGTYTVSVIVNYPFGPKGPCIDTTYKTITIIYGVNGVNNITSSNLKLKIFPNPAKAEINISVEDGENKEYIARIYNNDGTKITEQKFSKQTKISTADFPKGNYQVQVCNNDGRVCLTEKIILQ